MDDPLTTLVEAHDVAGLKEIIEDDLNVRCFSYPTVFKSDQSRLRTMQDFLLENKSAVERACDLGYLDLLEIFLRNGCSPNLPTSQGRLIHSVLILLKSNQSLVENGKALKLIKLMMKMDCDVNVKDHSHKSPLMLASELADPGIMNEILMRCLSWQLTCQSKDNGHTPLHMACMKGSVECVLLLLKKLSRQEVNMMDSKSYTPLMCSLKVLKNNLLVHSSDERSESMLMRVQYSHIAIVELLLKAGTSLTIGPVPLAFTLPHPCLSMAPLYTTLDVAHQYELIKLKLGLSEGQMTSESADQVDQEDVSREVQNILSLQVNDRKILSPYASLVRRLVEVGIDPFKVDDFDSLKACYPCIQGLLSEIKEYVQAKTITDSNGTCWKFPSLMNLSRKLVRLQTAQCNKLHLMDELPLPRKLKDFIMFIDF